MKKDFAGLLEQLEQDPTAGTPLGRNCYKIRLAISSKGRGKSGGARVITNLVVSSSSVYLLSIYDKTEKESLSDEELKFLLRQVPL